MTEIESKLRDKLDAFYDHLESQPMPADLRGFSAREIRPRAKFLQPLYTGAAGLVAVGVIILIGVSTHNGSNREPGTGPAGVGTSASSPSVTATPRPTATAVPIIPITPNPAFPGTALTLSGANSGHVSVTALRCSNKNQTGDTVIEGTVNGSNLTIQFLNPAIFSKPPFHTPTAGQPGQPYVSLWVWKTDASTAPNWSTFSTAGVTYGTTSIDVNIDLPAAARGTGTTHVTGTIACSS